MVALEEGQLLKEGKVRMEGNIILALMMKENTEMQSIAIIGMISFLF